MNERKHTPETATEEVLHEFEEAELDIDEEKRDRRGKNGEAADTLTPSPTAQESVRREKDRER
ncbi:hypothetical protein AB0A69_27170 [Streptomyces sp. NPDC045431]|uniref:hypothetical protein n=1 Tax=Streptomyces sp. NPDC045431 TaxID=3155613 RepID=UPI0033D20AB7